MDKLPAYPLEQLVEIKKNRFNQAVKILEEKKALLEKAKEKLKAAEKERDTVKSHRDAKLQQLREALDEGMRTDKIQQMKSYLKLVEEKLAVEQKKVKEQQKLVDLAQKQVELATQELFQRKKDLEKLEMHREEWSKEARYTIEQKSAVEHDEQGSATHTIRKRDASAREKKKKREQDT